MRSCAAGSISTDARLIATSAIAISESGCPAICIGRSYVRRAAARYSFSRRHGGCAKWKKARPIARPGLSVKLSGGRKTKRKLFGIRARGCRRGRFVLRASSQSERANRDREKHQGFNKFHSVNRPLSEQVAAVI